MSLFMGLSIVDFIESRDPYEYVSYVVYPLLVISCISYILESTIKYSDLSSVHSFFKSTTEINESYAKLLKGYVSNNSHDSDDSHEPDSTSPHSSFLLAFCTLKKRKIMTTFSAAFLNGFTGFISSYKLFYEKQKDGWEMIPFIFFGAAVSYTQFHFLNPQNKTSPKMFSSLALWQSLGKAFFMLESFESIASAILESTVGDNKLIFRIIAFLILLHTHYKARVSRQADLAYARDKDTLHFKDKVGFYLLVVCLSDIFVSCTTGFGATIKFRENFLNMERDAELTTVEWGCSIFFSCICFINFFPNLRFGAVSIDDGGYQNPYDLCSVCRSHTPPTPPSP